MATRQPPLRMTRTGTVHVVMFHHNIMDPIDVDTSNHDLYSLCDQTTRPRFLLDLENVDMINSKLLGVIMGLNLKVLRKQGELRLCGIKPRVREVLNLTRLDEILHVHGTCDEAMKAFK